MVAWTALFLVRLYEMAIGLYEMLLCDLFRKEGSLGWESASKSEAFWPPRTNCFMKYFVATKVFIC